MGTKQDKKEAKAAKKAEKERLEKEAEEAAKKDAEAAKAESSSPDSSSDSESEDETPTETPAVVTKKQDDKEEDSSSDSGSDSDDSTKSSEEVDEKMDDTEDGNSKKRKNVDEDSSPSKKVAVEDPSVNTTMYIKGLPWRATEDQVYKYFKGCGEISIVKLPLQDDGRSSGTAVIKFTTAEACKKCLELDKADFNGRWLKIVYARANAVSLNKLKELSEKPEDCKTVFVGNLNFKIDQKTIKKLFKDCGEIEHVRFATDRETGKVKGFGYIEFVNAESVDEAIKLQGQMVMGRPISVDYAENRRSDAVFGNGKDSRGHGGERFSRGRGGRREFSGNKTRFN